MLTKEEVIRHLCETVALAYHSIGDYSSPSDGFCDQCPTFGSFQHSGKMLDYVRDAVIAKLKADGVKLDTCIAEHMVGTI
jgi:hypothetical protein